METLRAISLRRTVRRFKPRRIFEKTLLKILEAGNQAPNAGNIQTTRFILVTDPDLKKEVAKCAADQSWLTKAYVLIVLCSITDKVERNYGSRGKKLYAIQNTSLAAQNILVAATAANIGSAFVSAIADKTIRRVLSIPDNIDIHSIIALGYPERVPKCPAKAALADITYYSKWGNKTSEGFSIFPLESAAKSIKSTISKKLKRK